MNIRREKPHSTWGPEVVGNAGDNGGRQRSAPRHLRLTCLKSTRIDVEIFLLPQSHQAGSLLTLSLQSWWPKSAKRQAMPVQMQKPRERRACEPCPGMPHGRALI